MGAVGKPRHLLESEGGNGIDPFLEHEGGHAQQAQFPKFPPQVVGEVISLINLLGSGRDFVVGKIPHGLPDNVYGLTQGVFQRRYDHSSKRHDSLL